MHSKDEEKKRKKRKMFIGSNNIFIKNTKNSKLCFPRGITLCTNIDILHKFVVVPYTDNLAF